MVNLTKVALISLLAALALTGCTSLGRLAADESLDLSLRHRLDANWELAASARNLVGADVREPSPAPGLPLPHDLPMAGRSLSLQATYFY